MPTMTTTDLQALFSDVCQAWTRGDADGLAAHYAVDGRLISPFGDVLDGRDAVRAGFAGLFAGLLAGTRTEIAVQDVRALAPGLSVVDGTQSITGPLPPLHFTAVVRQVGEAAEILECRPYAFLAAP